MIEGPREMIKEDVEGIEVDDQLVKLPPAIVTMTSMIRLCIENKPALRTVDEGYHKPRQCDRLIKLLIEGDPSKCLSLWSELRPEYLIDEGRLVFKNSNIRERGPSGFMNEIKVFGFSEALTNEAHQIHLQLDRIIRKKANRKQLFFYCFYYASRNLKIPMFPEELAEKINISNASMSRALNSINPLHYGMAISNWYPTPQYYLPRILDDMDLSPEISSVVSIVLNNLLRDNPMITNYYKPHKIAMAAVINFMNSTGIDPPENLDHILLRGNQKELEYIMKTLEEYDYI